MKRPLKPQLPEYLSFATPELALAAADYMAAVHGWSRDTNILPKTAINPSFIGIISLHFWNGKTISWHGRTFQEGNHSSTLGEFFNLIEEEPLMIDTHVVDIRLDGVQVGCTFVDWATVEKIAALKP